MRIQHANPDTVAPPGGAYSHVVRVETEEAVTLYVSGQVAFDRQGRLVGEDDMGRQTEAVFENLRAILEANGASFDDVVKVTTFLTDMRQLQSVRDVRAPYLGEPPPPAPPSRWPPCSVRTR
jgi:2-iminobutanoate/2-iminopropanoate deaminase